MKKLLKVNCKHLLMLFWVICSWGSLSMPLLAQTDTFNSGKPSQNKINFHPVANVSPPDRGTPPANEGTGSRGDCLYAQNSPPLTSLVGNHNLKFTTQEHPTFWVYIPYTSQETEEAEFSLQDGDIEVFRSRFKLDATPGIVGISLPAEVPSLVVGKEYRWYLDINCSVSASESSTPASLTGLVERLSISPQLQQKLNSAKTPLEKINIYAQNGVWLEVLTKLAKLRLQEPQNPQLRNAWIELLSADNVGLAKIAEEPIVGDITANSLLK